MENMVIFTAKDARELFHQKQREARLVAVREVEVSLRHAACQGYTSFRHDRSAGKLGTLAESELETLVEEFRAAGYTVTHHGMTTVEFTFDD